MNNVYILKTKGKFLAVDNKNRSYYTDDINLAFKCSSKLMLKHLSVIKKDVEFIKVNH